MAQLKLTKMELRIQQIKLSQLQKYLPTLQLKKALLQMEVLNAETEIEALFKEFAITEQNAAYFSQLFTDRGAGELFFSLKIFDVEKKLENIAGIDVPSFERVVFEEERYALFDTPLWLEDAIEGMKKLLISREKILIGREKKAVLEKELREVSIRVNLFEKVMIPRAQDNIKKIKIFLGDQQLAAVSQAKMSKKKILERKGS